MNIHQIEIGVYEGYTYDATQTSDEIRDGDVIVAGSVVGFMYSAWPVAITVDHGEWHQADGPEGAAHIRDVGEYAESVAAAIAYAQNAGFAVNPEWMGAA